MINMMKLAYVPGCCEWVHSPGDAVSVLAVYRYFQWIIKQSFAMKIINMSFFSSRSDSESGTINLYDGHGVNVPIHKIETMHSKPVQLIKVKIKSIQNLFYPSSFT